MAGVVDQHVDGLDALLHGPGHRGDALLVGDVDGDDVQRLVLSARRGGVPPGPPGVECRWGEVAGHDGVAVGKKAVDDLGSDAAGRSGDHDRACCAHGCSSRDWWIHNARGLGRDRGLPSTMVRGRSPTLEGVSA